MDREENGYSLGASLPVAEALKQAFIVSWKFKWFWPLGFILNPQVLGINYFPGGYRFDELPSTGEIFFWVGLIGIIAFLFSLASALVQPTLILAVDAYRQGKSPRFWESLRTGFDYFLKVWLLGLLWVFGGVSVILVIALPVVAAFAVNTVLGILAVLLALTVMLALALFLVPIASFAYRHLVLENLGIIESIKAAYTTFVSMKGRSIGILVASLAIIFAVYMAVSIPASIIQVGIEFGGGAKATPLYAVYLLFAFAFSIVFQGYMQSFGSAVWTLVFPVYGRTNSESDDATDAPPALSD